MVKGFRVNGQVYTIVIVEEVPNQERGECSCHNYHYASSDSILSSDTVVEETYLSGRSSDEGDIHGYDGMRRDVVLEAVGQTQPLVQTNWKILENKA